MATKKRKETIKRKPAKKRVLKKKVATEKKTLKKKRPVAKSVRKKTPAEQPVAKITHFFPHVQAGVAKILRGSLEAGQTVHIKGHTTDFTQTIDSMQIDHVPITKANKGAEIGLKVTSRVRHGDLIFIAK